MARICLTSYAKINLTLSITGRREDGYHLLESMMQEISLADTLEMEAIPHGISLTCTDPTLPTDEKNLCYRAAKRYLEAGGFEGGVRIHLTKIIPHGAGMGGGSSNAAAVLKGMSALYPAVLPLDQIALGLGADVPFFLQGKTGFCKGIGEVISPVLFPGKKEVFCVVAKNCPGLSTPAIYKAFDEGGCPAIKRPSEEAIRKALLSSPEAFYPLMHNDLEAAAMALRPEIGELKGRILSQGADAAMMTGSGSAVFGLFSQKEKASACAEALKQEKIRAELCTLI